MDFIIGMHWFYVAVMAAGALWIGWWAREPRGVPGYEYLLHASIPIWSGAAYLAIAFSLGRAEIGESTVYVARYVDWLVTTPLLLIVLGMTAMHYLERKNVALLVGLVFADVFMISSGLIADLTTSDAARFTYYGLGVVALLVILWGIWVPLRRIAAAQLDELGRRYTALATYHSILWVGYPVVWILGPSGLGLFGEEVDVALFVLLPIFSKVGFSIFDLWILRNLPDREEVGQVTLGQDAAILHR